VKNIFP